MSYQIGAVCHCYELAGDPYLEQVAVYLESYWTPFPTPSSVNVFVPCT